LQPDALKTYLDNMNLREKLAAFNYQPAPADDGVPKVYRETFVNALGNIYTGEANKGQPHGKGELVFSNGRFIEGYWQYGRPLRARDFFA
jgi:hypothetical protein